jgi:polyhydroxyalkanoate synthesis regulator phasin
MALTEFLHLLCRPIETSLQQHSQCPAWGQAASLAEHPEAAYRQWISALEGCYLTLFESREYQLSLHKTLQALNEFMQARQSILEDMLKLWPVATHSDLDELTQEIYQLKKLVHRLAKELAYPNQ